MPDRVTRHFPLFPLGLVALPHEYVPLHIFEPRYRTMIAECLEQEREFGIVWTGDDGRRPIGCAMRIDRVLERMEDGRLNILTQGTRPFRIVEDRLDTWTFESLDEEIRHPEWGEDWVQTRGSMLQRVFAHDVYHAAELNEWLGRAGLPEMALWDW